MWKDAITSMLWSISGGGPEVDLLPLPPPRPLPPLPPRPRPLFPPWTNIPGEVVPESTRVCTPPTPSCPGIPTFADTNATLVREFSVPVTGEWGGLGVDGRLGEYWMEALPEFTKNLLSEDTQIFREYGCRRECKGVPPGAIKAEVEGREGKGAIQYSYREGVR